MVGRTAQRLNLFAVSLAGLAVALAFACTDYDTAGGAADGGGGGVMPPLNKPDASETCSAPKGLCGTTCIDLTKNDRNCGACGITCDNGYMCTAGCCEIACSIGSTACKGVATSADAGADSASDAATSPTDGATTNPSVPYCTNLAIDPANCGTCGNSCVNGKICSAGVCCQNGQAACGGACTVLATDANNCGTCGKVCPAATPICSNGMCTDRYRVTGVQLDVPASTATRGWTACFSEEYSQATPLSAIQAACNKANVMMACRRTGSANFQLLAQAPRSDVFFNTGDANTAKHEANGVAWYWSDNASFGFAPGGLSVDRSNCDYIDSYGGSPQAGIGQGDKRMCTHTSGGSSNDGWRCGRDNSLSSGWERILYHAD